jgi:hypothetical protein
MRLIHSHRAFGGDHTGRGTSVTQLLWRHVARVAARGARPHTDAGGDYSRWSLRTSVQVFAGVAVSLGLGIATLAILALRSGDAPKA